VITLAIDNFGNSGRPLPNGMRPEQCVNDDFAEDWPRLDYPRLFYYLKESGIDVAVKQTEEADSEAWYPITVGWFDFTLDYFDLINPTVLARNMKIVFLYHEADNPGHINKRLMELAELHGHDNMAFISGNSAADQYRFCHYWPELEYMYRRSVDFKQAATAHFKHRSKHFTGLCRIDKLWRKIFMSNLWKKGLHHNGYFSYCQEFLGEQDEWAGVPLLNEFISGRESEFTEFIQAGPFLVDELSSRERNDYAVLSKNFYEDSYFNIVLETFIDVDSSGGQFITEKTFKPILNNQPFICVAEHNHMRHLRELGYETFHTLWNEDYDAIEDTQQRFEAAMELSEELAGMTLNDLHELYVKSVPILEHNRNKLENDVTHRLHALVDDIMSKPSRYTSVQSDLRHSDH